MQKRKRPFLLLELLIAVTLLTLFSIPLIIEPFYLLKKEMNALQCIELERLAEVEFADLKKKIYNQEIPWETLTQTTASSLPEKEVIIHLPPICKQRFKVRTSICSLQHFSNPAKKEEGHFLKIKTEYIPKPRNQHKKSITIYHRLFINKQ